MSRVYFAAPLFSEGEKIFNERVVDVLEKAGYEVFLPQRDGIVAAEMMGKTHEEIVDIVFTKDISELKKSDILLFLLDGRVPDDGGCVELGLAYAYGKRCYAVTTDVRAFQKNLPINPMLEGCFIKIFADTSGDILIENLKNYLKNNEL